MENNTELKKARLSRCYRVFLFFIMVSIEGIMNVSSGILSSASKEIKSELNINDTTFGSFGFANSFGRIISSILISAINKIVSRKWTTTIGAGLHALFVVLFVLTKNPHILIFIRGLHGFTQMLPSIYIPVWVEQFSIRKYRTVQITVVQLFQTTGKCVGYFFNNMFGNTNWRRGILIEAGYLTFCTICCLISHENYFSRTLFRPDVPEDKANELRVSCTVYEEREAKEEQKGNFISDLKILFCHKLFMLSMCCRIILHGLNTCLHFWLADFIRTLNPQEELRRITICYSLICFAGPLGGVIFNQVFKPIIGNYDTKKASWPLVYLQIAASVFAISIGFMDTTIKITIVTICFLIFNSSALPLLQGMLIKSVDPSLSFTAFGIANILTQVITSGTTPVIYGRINDLYKEKYPSLAMKCIMTLELLAVPLLCVFAYLRNKKFDKEAELKEKEQGQELVDKN